MPKKNRIPSWIPTLLVAAVIFAVVLYAGKTGRLSTYWYQVIQLAALTAISALGLNLIYGFNGQFSLGHIGFYAIGAYGSALITKDFMGQWSGSPVGAVSWMIAGQLGVLVVLLAIRLMRIGVLVKRMRASLERGLKGHEAWVLSTVVAAVLVAVSLAVGVVAAGLLHSVLAAVLGGFFAVVPEAWRSRRSLSWPCSPAPPWPLCWATWWVCRCCGWARTISASPRWALPS